MESLISVLIGSLVVLILLPVRVLFPSNDFRKTMKALNSHSDYKEKTNTIEKSLLNKISDLGMAINKVFQIKFSRSKSVHIERKLIQSGLKSRFTVETFMGLKIGMLVVGILYGFLLSSLTPVATIKYMCYLSIMVLYFWPNMWLENKIRDRRHQIQKEMPFVLSSMAIIIESGLSLMQAITEVSKMRKGALVEEFQLTMLEIDVGFSRVEAFERMMDRVEVTEMSLFLSSLIQSIEKGSSGIADILKKQSDEMWKRRKEKARELAEKASIKLFLPLLLFVLPALLLFVLTPAVMSLIHMF